MSLLLINEPPLQVLPSLAVAIGLNEAIVLQQIHYWTLRTKPAEDGNVWVYNSVEQWREQFPFWSADTIGRALKALRDMGILIAERRGNNSFDKTLHYRIDREVLDSVDTGNLRQSTPQPKRAAPQDAATHGGNLRQSAVAESGNLCTETTAETTAERGAAATAPAASPKPPKARAGKMLFACPEGVDPVAWDDFMLVRKAKRAPMTQTALDAMQREADKAGLTLDAAVRACCQANWQNFNAAWWAERNPQQPVARRPGQPAPAGSDDEINRAARLKYGIGGDFIDMED